MIPQGSIFSSYTHIHSYTRTHTHHILTQTCSHDHTHTHTHLLTQSTHTHLLTQSHTHTHLLTQSHTHTIRHTHVTRLNSNAGPNSKQYILAAVRGVVEIARCACHVHSSSMAQHCSHMTTYSIHMHTHAYPESTSLDSPTRRW